MQVPELAFPDNDCLPAHFPKLKVIALVPRNVLLELVRPEFLPCLGCGCPLAAFVPMPKATVHEHHGTVSWQDQVRLARQVLGVEAEPESITVEKASNDSLRLGILGTDAPHNIGPLLLGKNVHH